MRRTALFGCVFCALVPFGAGAQDISAPVAPTAVSTQDSGSTEVTPAQLRDLAIRALAAGRPDVAASFADALLGRDPDDHAALLIRSRAMRDMGRNEAALADARTAWALADTPQEKFDSAMFRAQALSSAGRKTMAMLWLRRASDLAPDEASSARVKRDFGYVRASNPWSTELSFSVAPSSNINNGSSRETISLYGLPFELTLNGAARALSGTVLTFGLDTRYRMSQSAKHAHDLLLELYHRTYIMSDEAKRQAPGTEGSDFAFSTAAAGYGYKYIAGSSEHSFSALFGQNWYAGDPYGNFVRGEYTLRHLIDRKTRLTFGLVGEHRFNDPAPEAKVAQFFSSVDRRLDGGAQIGAFGSLTVSQSDSASADYRDIRLGIYGSPAQPVLGATPTLSLTVRKRNYDRSPLSFNGREDRELAARLDLVFRKIDYFGFNPRVTFTASRVESSVGFYDSEQLGVQVGIRSAF